MKNIKRLVSDIHNGKNLRVNLEIYRDLSVGTYHDYASLELVFAAYTLMEELAEITPEYASKEKAILEKLENGMKAVSEADMDSKQLVKDMEQIRQEITSKMDLFTMYTDQLICYEYVLNRMELSFLPPKKLEQMIAKYPENDFMQRLMIYIFSTNDQAVITENIRTVMGQLPVRMTKAKFFERLSESLTLYKGGDKSALDSFVYMIRTSGLVYEANDYQDEYKDFKEFIHELEECDYATLTEEQYDELTKKLEEAAKQIHQITDFYYSLQKVANSIYAVAVCHLYDEDLSTTVNESKKVLQAITQKEASDDMLVPLEGRIEKYVEDSSYLEAVLFEIRSSYHEDLALLGYTELFDDLATVANLLSGSLFIDLSKEDEETVVDAAYVSKLTESLTAQIDNKMKQVSKPVRRAMMGMMLEKLPMLFANSDEVKKYIQTNLFECNDKVEKAAVLDILDNVMKED